MGYRSLHSLGAAVLLAVSCTATAAAGPEVEGVVLDGESSLAWDPVPGALAYNVYRRALGIDPPFGGQCLHSALAAPPFALSSSPLAGGLWQLQVTAVFDDGEGTMGTTSQGVPRSPAAPCVCTLPPDIGPCDGVFPRWYYDVAAGQCLLFNWGGCEGNANKFETEEQCTAACPG